MSAATVDPLGDGPDDLLVAELGRVAGIADPVPADWAVAARDAFAWLHLPGEPARLTYDSQPGTDGGRGPIAATAARTVRFTAGAGASRVVIEVEVDRGADKLRVVGRIRPGRRASVVAVTPTGRAPAEADAAGGFHVDELPRAPFCLLVGGVQPVKTGWIVT